MDASRASRRGFTLVELMIVVAVLGILSAIALPKFAELIRKSSEGSAKGNLGTVRSALSIYYADMEGLYPSDLYSLTAAKKYLAEIPFARTPNYHVDTSAVVQDGSNNAVTDEGGWAYVNAPGDGNFGALWVNCTHSDTRGSAWTVY